MRAPDTQKLEDEIETLEKEKRQAVEDEDYIAAAQIKTKLAEKEEELRKKKLRGPKRGRLQHGQSHRPEPSSTPPQGGSKEVGQLFFKIAALTWTRKLPRVMNVFDFHHPSLFSQRSEDSCFPSPLCSDVPWPILGAYDRTARKADRTARKAEERGSRQGGL